MKKNLFFVVFFVLGILNSFSQENKINYLYNPDLIKDFVIDCAEFWENAYDETNQGFFVEVNRQGIVTNNSYKNLVIESRDAYGFTRAFMLTGNIEYLEKAENTLNFMFENLWDEQYGGWLNTCNADGSGAFSNLKTAFDQFYGLLGVTTYFEATRNQNVWEKLLQSYNFNETNLWDNDETNFGYFDYLDANSSNPYGKSFNATMDAITTHLYSLYLMTEDEIYYNRLMQLQDNVHNHFLTSMNEQEIGFAEKYNSNWQIDASETMTIMGHVLKTAWCLGRIYNINSQEEILDDAELLIDEVLEKGYDHQFGGPYKDYNRVTGEMLMWGALDTAKAWWQMEQAITSGLVLFDITEDYKYLDMASESLDFFMNYFVDNEYGEVYPDRSKEGGRVYYSGGYWGEDKGNTSKAAYHTIELGYYSYLYSKLLVKNEPVTLFYQIEENSEEQNLKMTPLTLDFDKLTITNVTKDGIEYTNYDENQRILTIPANTSGLFAITYDYDAPFVQIKENEDIDDILITIYPNPFKQVTKVKFNLSENQHVEFVIFNQIGQKVFFDEKSCNSGENFFEWKAENNLSGLYFYKIKFKEKEISGKMIKM